MAGLDPAIHALGPQGRRGCPADHGVYARLRRAMAGHDGAKM